MQDALILRLDEYEVGGITLTGLEKFVGAESLESTVKNFIRHVNRGLYDGVLKRSMLIVCCNISLSRYKQRFRFTKLSFFLQ